MKYLSTNFYKLLHVSILLFAVSFMLTSCEEDDPAGEDNEITLTADAGSDMTVDVGDQVVLDGSSSTASEGSFDFLWSFTSKPSGSNAQMDGATTVSPTFTADVAGDYEVQLTITNGNKSDTDNTTVTAGSSAEGTKEVSGDVDENTTWTDHVSDPNTPDYRITASIGVNAQLTIEPGVLIHVDEDKGIWVNSEGVISSQGTAGSEVVFTSSNEAGQLHWKGILVRSSDVNNALDYTVVKWAGNSEFNHGGTNYAHAVGIEGGRLSITNSTIANSAAYGFFHHSGDLGTFSQNSFSGNADYAMRIQASQVAKLDESTSFEDGGNAVNIYGSTLDEGSETQWNALSARMNARYYVSGDININSYLEILPGAKFDFAEDVAFLVNSDATLIADATESETIVFTSKNAASEVYWKGIFLSSNDARNILSNVEIAYAGNSEWNFSGTNYATALGIENGKIALLNTTISNSLDYGLYLHTGSFVDFGSNAFENNEGHAIALMMEAAGSIDAATTFAGNGWDGVTIYSSTMTEEATWASLAGDAKYRAIGDLYAEAGLTINAGAELTFDEHQALIIKNTGYLIANGSASNMIRFTSSNEAGQIHWKGIWIQSSDARNEMNYTEVNLAGSEEFGFGGTNYAAAIAGDDDDSPRLTLTNSTVKNSLSFAVYWEGGTINNVLSVAANNTFLNNGETPDVIIP